MTKWNINQKPTLEECPEEFCFSWTPSGGSADLSGQSYDSFEEAVASSGTGVTFRHGGCATPFGPCRRDTKNLNDGDCYEPFERILRKNKLPDLFFCNPECLSKEYIEEYKIMAEKLWSENV